MKDLIKKLLREGVEYKSISIKHLKGVLKNTTNKTGIKILKQWISDGGDFVKLSLKQRQLLLDIEKVDQNQVCMDQRSSLAAKTYSRGLYLTYAL